MDDDKIWVLERDFWLQGSRHFEKMLAPGCIMVFPPPIGIMTGAAILASLASAPRWTDVGMSDRVLSRFGSRFLVLSYRVEAHRSGSAPYRALCSSSYVELEAGWRLAQHQQTPA